jgi:hypothetical protein
MRIQKSRIACLGLMAVVAGCGGKASDLPKLAPVAGTVTLDGKPLAKAMVAFIPTGSTRGTGANGHTDNAGKYELAARSGEKGAPAGEYRVAITKLVMPDGSDFPANSAVPPINSAAQQVLPAKYSMARQTVLAAKVGDSANVIDFPLSTK